MSRPSKTKEPRKRKDVFFGLRIEKRTLTFIEDVGSSVGVTSKSAVARGIIEGVHSLVEDGCIVVKEGRSIVVRRVNEGRKKTSRDK